MPFLVEAIAKEKNETIALTQMFEPQKAIEYGMHQIQYLKKHLYHPLIVAYAYNGGIGFTKRKIIERGLFEDKRFEPWLSMELVPYSESKRYGKKVLANYYVYKKLLDEPVQIESLIEPLSNGSKIARWR
jgi:soluble lytic murein transglycosylase